MRKPFGAGAHCAIDYGFVAFLLLTPRFFHLSDKARAISYGFGAAAGILTACTDQPYGVMRLVPFRVHGLIDTPFVPTLVLLPWIAGALKQRNARRFFLSFCAAALTNYLLTDYTASE